MRLKELQDKYTQNFYSALAQMLIMDPVLRPNYIEMDEFLGTVKELEG